MSDAVDLTMVDWIDSYYQYVRSRVVGTLDSPGCNPNRVFGGIVQTRAWPFKDVRYEAFYLLLGSTDPVQGISWASPGYTNTVRWVWQIRGTDLESNVIGLNRSDRFSTHYKMCQEMLYGCFPGFCDKQTWAVELVNNLPVLESIPYDPSEQIWFPKPRFSDQYDATNGILTGGALTAVSSFSPSLG